MKERKKATHLTTGELDMLLNAISGGEIDGEHLTKGEIDTLLTAMSAGGVPDPWADTGLRRETKPEELLEYFDYHGYPAMVALLEEFLRQPWVRLFHFEEYQLCLSLDLESRMPAKRRELKEALEREHPEWIRFGILEVIPNQYTFHVTHLPDRSHEPVRCAGRRLYDSEEERIRACSVDSYDLCIDERWEHRLIRGQIISRVENWLTTQ
jgi:hypothetical protein